MNLGFIVFKKTSVLDMNSLIYKNYCTKRTLRSLIVKDNREKKKVEWGKSVREVKQNQKMQGRTHQGFYFYFFLTFSLFHSIIPFLPSLPFFSFFSGILPSLSPTFKQKWNPQVHPFHLPVWSWKFRQKLMGNSYIVNMDLTENLFHRHVISWDNSTVFKAGWKLLCNNICRSFSVIMNWVIIMKGKIWKVCTQAMHFAIILQPSTSWHDFQGYCIRVVSQKVTLPEGSLLTIIRAFPDRVHSVNWCSGL